MHATNNVCNGYAEIAWGADDANMTGCIRTDGVSTECAVVETAEGVAHVGGRAAEPLALMCSYNRQNSRSSKGSKQQRLEAEPWRSD
jgi:hypothetical protein